jgi:hypothetical protein
VESVLHAMFAISCKLLSVKKRPYTSKNTCPFSKEKDMSFKIFAGDFKSGRASSDGFYLEHGGAKSLEELIPLSQVQVLKRLDNIKEILNYEESELSRTLDLQAFTNLTADGKLTDVPFFIRFTDGRMMIGLANLETWNQLMLGDGVGVPDCIGENSRSSPTVESYGAHAHFDRIDWVAAAPSWASMVVGGILPVVAVFALICVIDVLLCWVFEKWIGHFWAVPLWLVATTAFPLALLGVFAFAKVILQILDLVGWSRNRDKFFELSKISSRISPTVPRG